MGKVRSWEVSDEFWKRVEPFIPVRKRLSEGGYRRKPGGGRKPMDPRKTFEGIVFVLHTGCQWKALPKERFGSASSVHKYFREWLKAKYVSLDALNETIRFATATTVRWTSRVLPAPQEHFADSRRKTDADYDAAKIRTPTASLFLSQNESERSDVSGLDRGVELCCVTSLLARPIA